MKKIQSIWIALLMSVGMQQTFVIPTLPVLTAVTCTVGVLSSGCETAHGWGRDSNNPNLSNFGLYSQDLDIFNAYRDHWIYLPKGEVIAPGELFKGDLKKLSFYTQDGYLSVRFEVRDRNGEVVDIFIRRYYIPANYSVSYYEEFGPRR